MGIVNLKQNNFEIEIKQNKGNINILLVNPEFRDEPNYKGHWVFNHKIESLESANNIVAKFKRQGYVTIENFKSLRGA